MALFKYETHLHTSEGSACGNWNAEVAVRRLHELGYSGCFVTDHFLNSNTSVDTRLPWDIQVNLFCQGYEKAKKVGDELGFDVWFGWEFSWNCADFLTYGLDKQFLLNHPNVIHMAPDEYIDLVHKCGGFVVQAHPFRDRGYISGLHIYFKHVDGIEAINCGNDPIANERAIWFADSCGLPKTGGSDAHHLWWYKAGGIVLEEKLSCPNDYLNCMREGKIQKILEGDSSCHVECPEDSDCLIIRNDIKLLPEDLRIRAEQWYKENE